MTTDHQQPPIEDRFWSKVQKGPGCWLWRSANDGRYGSFYYMRRVVKAHRMSWLLTYGAIPHGREVCHHCDVPACVRPEHLYIGTHGQNMRDAFARNRIDNAKKGRTWSARLRREPKLRRTVLANLHPRRKAPRSASTGRFLKDGTNER